MEFRSIRFTYRVNGRNYSLVTDHSAKNKRVSVNVVYENDVFGVSVETRTPVEIVELSAVFEYDFREDMRIFLNGYQSWTDSREYGIHGIMRGVDQIPAAVKKKYSPDRYGDYGFVRYGKKAGQLHGFSYGYIRHDTGVYDLFGSLNENDGFTVIRTDTDAHSIRFVKDCAGLTVNGSYGGLSVYIGSGTEDEVFDRYFELMDIAPPAAEPVWGYTSWYRHYQDINEDIIAEDLRGSTEHSHKADIFQIDDGYQTAVGDWLSVDENKFPGSMKAVSERIAEAGLTPGIWLAPFVCEEKSVLFREHSDWLLKDENGQPVRTGCNWSGHYALDLYDQEVRSYLRRVFDTVVNEWGFKLLKLDFLYAVCILPRPDKTRGRIMSDAMDFLREITHGAQILGCGVPLASAFGKVDYCRIGTDVSLDWDDKLYMRMMHRERPSTKNTVLNTVFRRQLNGRAFINDPDVYMLRDDHNTMTDEQKSCLAAVNVLCGGVLFTSDNQGEYKEKQKSMLEQMERLSHARVKAAAIEDEILILAAELDGRTDIITFDIS